MINTKTKIASFEFENCLMNASGVSCYDVNELNALENSEAATLVTKSATLAYREGNPSPRYYDLALGSINSMGLPNLGIDFYLDYVLENEKKGTQPPYFMSVAGLSLDENLSILKKIQDSAFKGLLELNLSCPNVPGKPQTAYDFEHTQDMLTQVFSFYTKPLGVKMPPYFDMVHFQQMAAILNQFPLAFVTSINSVGNALFIDVDQEAVVIKPKDGFGGLGGAYVKPTALANVRAFYTLLNPSIQVIGCGGVETGKDVFEHILCGASMVQVGTQLMKEGPDAFARILTELKTLMAEKNYRSFDDFRGKLKSL